MATVPVVHAPYSVIVSVKAWQASGSGGQQGHLVFGCGVAQQEENELRVLSYVGPCFPGTLHMSQNPFAR
jgi:hypothetical protein